MPIIGPNDAFLGWFKDVLTRLCEMQKDINILKNRTMTTDNEDSPNLWFENEEELLGAANELREKKHILVRISDV